MRLGKSLALLTASLLFFGAVVAQSAGAAAAPAPKHIVFLLRDDEGYSNGTNLKKFGSKTPNLDWIAAEGIRFTVPFAPHLCQPSRAELATGRSSPLIGLRGNIADTKPVTGVPTQYPTLAEQLTNLGYLTAVVGKWHMGGAPDKSLENGRQPWQRGFRESWVFYDGHHCYTKIGCDVDDTNNQIYHGGVGLREEVVSIADDKHIGYYFAETAIRWMRAHRDEKTFLYLPVNSVHTPAQATPEALAAFASVADPQLRMILAMYYDLDHIVGMVLAAALEIDHDNTLFITESDNGGDCGNGLSDPVLHVTENLKCSNLPEMGNKGHADPGGILVPASVYWPAGDIRAGTTFNQPAFMYDWFPTIMDAASGGTYAAPASYKLNGISLLPYLRNPSLAVPKRKYFAWGRNKVIAAMLDWPYFLERLQDGTTYNLYNLQNDRGTKILLNSSMPARLQSMKASLLAWIASLPPAKNGNN